MTFIVFLLVLSFLVLIHEMGHLLVALWFKVRVEEFGIGLPPRAKVLFKKYGIDFTLNWLPVGGFVRLFGEEQHIHESMGASLKTNSKEVKEKGLFYRKAWWKKILIILAGATVNFVFGIIAFSLVYTISGIPELQKLDAGVAITEISPNSPAEKAGLLVDDVILELKSQAGEVIPIENIDAFVAQVSKFKGEAISLKIVRDNTEELKQVYVRKTDETPKGDGAVGVGIANDKVILRHYPIYEMPFRGAWTGLKAAWSFGLMILYAIGSMVRDLVTAGVVPKDISGPVGIVYSAQKSGLLREGLLAILNFAGILSINLAVVNVLPIPALDGGRAVFILIEKLMGKRYKPKYEHYANLVGFGLLLTLIVLVSVRDVGTILTEQRGAIMRLLGK
jgi:regulator of sigma E protease